MERRLIYGFYGNPLVAGEINTISPYIAGITVPYQSVLVSINFYASIQNVAGVCRIPKSIELQINSPTSPLHAGNLLGPTNLIAGASDLTNAIFACTINGQVPFWSYKMGENIFIENANYSFDFQIRETVVATDLIRLVWRLTFERVQESAPTYPALDFKPPVS